MRNDPLSFLGDELNTLKAQGLYRKLRVLDGEQAARAVVDGKPVVNLSSNNYLGLTTHPKLKQKALAALEQFGVGTGSVRTIAGTMALHMELERRLAEFKKTEATVVFQSGFAANAGTVAAVLTKEDIVISDELNHASIIDGVRLCKAQRYRYRNCNMADLEAQLQAAKDARFRLIATDGVFSMDGTIANLKGVCELAEKYDAMVMVDDAHAAGFIGKTGRGTPEHCGVQGRIDIITGTLGKALGGASGGYTSGRKEIIDLLRQRSRPYLFSNTLAPSIAGATLKVLDMLTASTALRDKLESNTRFFRERMSGLGFNVLPGTHPIAPIMLGDAALAARVADAMLARGVYVIGFSFPVVPQGKARIRTQISAAHSTEELSFAIEQFAAVKRDLQL
jgi:glycine C-acetyltransferase